MISSRPWHREYLPTSKMLIGWGGCGLTPWGALGDQAHLQAGTVLDLYDGDMELKGGVAEYSVDEKIWVARVDWNKFRPLQSTEF